MHKKLRYQLHKRKLEIDDLQQTVQHQQTELNSTQIQLVQTQHLVKVVQREADVKLNDQHIEFTHQLHSFTPQGLLRTTRTLQRNYEQDKQQIKLKAEQAEKERVNRLQRQVTKLIKDNEQIAKQTLNEQLQIQRSELQNKKRYLYQILIIFLLFL